MDVKYKIIQISDLVQWYEKDEIILSPKYQRNKVWNESAKSYLMDSIVRGLPIPPIFIRQNIDVVTKSVSREIIDGQQRVRAILEFVMEERFEISRLHNPEVGMKKYSDLDDEIKEKILTYEIFVDVVNNEDDALIYDMFARLNSNNYVLNKQEIRNAKFWGKFKVCAYRNATEYRDFFLKYHIFTDNDCARMKDVELMNSLLLVINDGVVNETPKIIDDYYEKYDESFEDEIISRKISKVMSALMDVYQYHEGKLGCLQNKNIFYVVFCVVYNQMYGIIDENFERDVCFSEKNIFENMKLLEDVFGKFINDYEVKAKYNTEKVSGEWSEFIQNNKSRTTNKIERKQRIKFLNEYIFGKKDA